MDIKEFGIHQSLACTARHPWELARLAIVQGFFRQMIARAVTAPQRVLDVGSGDAFVIRHLSKAFPDLEFLCVDPALTDLQIAQFAAEPELARCRFFNSFETIENNGLLSDIVLLLDVLEHVDQDVCLLNQLAAFLNPGGQVLITVPAFQSLFCHHDQWLEHRRRYSKRQLQNCCRQAGLAPRECGFFFSALLMPRLLQKIFHLLQPKRNRHYAGIGQWSRGTRLSRALERLLIINAHLDLWLARHHLPHAGLSVYAICTR